MRDIYIWRSERGDTAVEESRSARKAANRLARKQQKETEEQDRRMLQKNKDEKYMRAALKLAEKAAELGEIPIGCVIVHDDRIIGRGYNRRNTDKSALSHAEIIAIRKASKAMGDWRLEDCTMYVTLEPCQMCAGAIVQARVTRVVMGCMNPKAGCGGSVLNVLQMPDFNHQADVTRGILQDECSGIITQFFKTLRLPPRRAVSKHGNTKNK